MIAPLQSRYGVATHRFLILTLFVTILPRISLATVDICETKLLTARLYDKALAAKLLPLNLDERATVHIPELVPYVRKTQTLTHVYPGAWQKSLLTFGDQLIANNQVTYFNFWHYVLLSLALRLPSVNKTPTDIEHFLQPQPGVPDLNYIFSVRDLEYEPSQFIERARNVFLSQGIMMPLIDPPKGLPVAFYPEGTYALIEDLRIFMVGIPRTDSNDFDNSEKQSGFQSALHDIAHAHGSTWFWSHLYADSGITLAELQTAHTTLTNKIRTAPDLKTLAARYEVLLHESYEIYPLFQHVLRPTALFPKVSDPKGRFRYFKPDTRFTRIAITNKYWWRGEAIPPHTENIMFHFTPSRLRDSKLAMFTVDLATGGRAKQIRANPQRRQFRPRTATRENCIVRSRASTTEFCFRRRSATAFS